MCAMLTSSVDSKPRKTCAAAANWRLIVTLCTGGGQRVWRDGMGEGEERGGRSRKGGRREGGTHRSSFHFRAERGWESCLLLRLGVEPGVFACDSQALLMILGSTGARRFEALFASMVQQPAPR